MVQCRRWKSTTIFTIFTHINCQFLQTGITSDSVTAVQTWEALTTDDRGVFGVYDPQKFVKHQYLKIILAAFSFYNVI